MLKFTAKIESVSPVREGTGYNGPWKCCDVVFKVSEQDRILATAFGEVCDFCQSYDRHEAMEVKPIIRFDVQSAANFSGRLFMKATVDSIEEMQPCEEI